VKGDGWGRRRGRKGEKSIGNNTPIFNRNFHIEPTNLCVYDCKFCSYSVLIKESGHGRLGIHHGRYA
jgi:2-iminoacetate synthase ThiH